MKRFFVTGSRYYGQPGKDSDFDILCKASDISGEALLRRGYVCMSRYPGNSNITRFKKGSRDVLLCTTDKMFELRLQARQECSSEAAKRGSGIDRDTAIKIHRDVESREYNFRRLSMELYTQMCNILHF